MGTCQPRRKKHKAFYEEQSLKISVHKPNITQWLALIDTSFVLIVITKEYKHLVLCMKTEQLLNKLFRDLPISFLF